MAPVTLVSVLEPVVVAQTLPFASPTMRTLSSWGEIPMAVMATFLAMRHLADDGHRRTPLSVER